ncbi:hypothetical protein Tco_0804150 [Tanacetum coccineum]|uniref:Uncharacterized protein n=1 Tax=Tanacetum coccineum TaxID=301880 RepID=A0ABQ5A7N7_9ASTR
MFYCEVWEGIQYVGPNSIKNIPCSTKITTPRSKATTLCNVMAKLLLDIRVDLGHSLDGSFLEHSNKYPSSQYSTHELIEECILTYPGIIWYDVGGFFLFPCSHQGKLKENENSVHIAAKLAPPHRLNVVTGTALQMQRELQWFKVRNQDDGNTFVHFTESDDRLGTERIRITHDSNDDTIMHDETSKRLTEGDRRSDLYDLALMLLRCVSFKDDPTEKNQEDQKKEFDNKLKKLEDTNPEAYYLIKKLANEPTRTQPNRLGSVTRLFFLDQMTRMNFLVYASDAVNEANNSVSYRKAKRVTVHVFDTWGWKEKVSTRGHRTMRRGGTVGGHYVYKDTLCGFLRLVTDASSRFLESTTNNYTLELFVQTKYTSENPLIK